MVCYHNHAKCIACWLRNPRVGAFGLDVLEQSDAQSGS